MPFCGGGHSIASTSSRLVHSSHGRSRVKLAYQLTLHYHTWSPVAGDPQSHRTALLARLSSSILPAPRAGSIAEREAGSACSRGEEITLCYVVECSRRASWRARTPVARGKSEFSHRLTHAQTDDRAFGCPCRRRLLHSIIRSQQCGADAAGKRTARPAKACRCRGPHAQASQGRTQTDAALAAF